jgi:hypothetical protein
MYCELWYDPDQSIVDKQIDPSEKIKATAILQIWLHLGFLAIAKNSDKI